MTTLPPSVTRWLDGMADKAERRQVQLIATFTKVHGRPPADDTELRTWLDQITTRSTS